MLHYYVDQWYRTIVQNRRIPDEVMEVPELSRETALRKMAQEALETSFDYYQCLRAGLERPMQWMLRKQFETRTNALFFSFDESGQSAFRYQHWQLADAAKQHPDDERIQGPLRASLELWGDTLKDRTGRNRGNWAKLPNGKTYPDLVKKAEYVAEVVKDIWPSAEVSLHDLDRIAQYDLKMYRGSNAIVHPSMFGRLNIGDFRLGLMSNNLFLGNALQAYRDSILHAFNSTELVREELQWHHVADAHNELALAVTRILDQEGAG